MESDVLKKLYDEVQARNGLYSENVAYIRGKNPVLARERAKAPPDNRVNCAFARKTIDTMCGFAASNIKVTHKRLIQTSETEKEEDEYSALMEKVYDWNDDSVFLPEVYREIVSQGKVYILLYTTDDMSLDKGMLTPEYIKIPIISGTMVYDDSLKPKKIYFVRFASDEEATVYYPRFFETYIKKRGEWVQVIEEGKVYQYPYTGVPVVEVVVDSDKEAIFQHAKDLINSYDRGVSRSQNDIDRFNAAIALLPGFADSNFREKLEEILAIDDLAQYTRWPEYLTKDLSLVDTFYNNHLDRLKTEYYQSVQVPNLADEKFSTGDESGVARAFKLLGMIFKAAVIEKYFKRAMIDRTALINDVIKASTYSIKSDDYTTELQMQYNLPIDEEVKVRIAQILKGLGVSQETILKYIPGTIVENVEDELRRIEEEKAKKPPMIIQDDEEGEE